MAKKNYPARQRGGGSGAAEKKKEKIIFWNFNQTPSYDTFLETRDLYEYFAEKIIEKYTFLAKLEHFS